MSSCVGAVDAIFGATERVADGFFVSTFSKILVYGWPQLKCFSNIAYKLKKTYKIKSPKQNVSLL